MNLGLMAGLHSQKTLSEYTCKGQNEGSNLRDKISGNVIYYPNKSPYRTL
jgi:hypothetical protein